MIRRIWRLLKKLFSRGDTADAVPNLHSEHSQQTGPDAQQRDLLSQLEKFRTSLVRVGIDREWFITLVLLGMLFAVAYVYLYVHGVHVPFRDLEWISGFDLIGDGGTGAVIFEVWMWSSAAVIFRRMRLLDDDLEQRRFKTYQYIAGTVRDVWTTPFLNSLVVFFVSFIELRLGNELQFSIDDLGLEAVIAISCLLAYLPNLAAWILSQIESSINPSGNNRTCETCRNFEDATKQSSRRQRHR